jgi:hypothetical protein
MQSFAPSPAHFLSAGEGPSNCSAIPPPSAIIRELRKAE